MSAHNHPPFAPTCAERVVGKCLVVIDPEDREQVERLDAAYQDALDKSPLFHGLVDVMQAALLSLIAPPKPPEPGKYGAVIDRDGTEWIRYTLSELDGRDWIAASGAGYAAYADIAAVRVLSEGVS